jgi:VIT1/CCC1 family predicted Fe2+/Mn2+ transporter
MPEENPYRFEGSAESLAKPREQPRQVRPPNGYALFFAGIFAALMAAILVPLISEPKAILESLFLTLFVLFPIGMYVGVLAKKRSRLKAQLGFWTAAAPLGLYFVAMLFDRGGDAGVVQLIGMYLLIGYGTQLLAAATVLGLMTSSLARS